MQLIKFTAKVALYGVQIWANRVLETVTGGFTLDITGLPANSVLRAGTPMAYDEITRLAKPLLTGSLQASATNADVAYKVKKGHLFTVGKFFSAVVGGKSYAITAIDTSNADYDLITVGTTLGVALNAGDTVFDSAASGASAGAYLNSPKGLLYTDMDIVANNTLTIVNRGTPYARRIPGLTPAIAALMPGISLNYSK